MIYLFFELLIFAALNQLLMKRFLLALFALFIAAAGHAQVLKGTIFMGGQVGTYTFNVPENQSLQENVAAVRPSIGLTIKQDLVVGLDFLSTHETIEGSTPQSKHLRDLGGGLYIRKYFTLGKNFYLFGNGRFGYDYSKQAFAYPQQQSSVQSIYSLSVYPGLAYAIKKWFYLEASLPSMLGLTYTKGNTTFTNSTQFTQHSSSLNFQTNLSAVSSISVGFRFAIGK